MRRRIGKKTQEFSGLRGLATLSLSFGFLGTKSPPYPTESFSLFLLQALECLFKAPSVKSFVKKLVRIYMWGLYILFIAFVFLWESGDRIYLPISLRTHGFVPSIIGDPDSNTLLSFEILSQFFWLMASCHVASRSLEPFLKDKYQERYCSNALLKWGCRMLNNPNRRLVNH